MEGAKPRYGGAFYQVGGTETQTAKSCGERLERVMGDHVHTGQGLCPLHIHQGCPSLGITYEGKPMEMVEGNICLKDYEVEKRD